MKSVWFPAASSPAPAFEPAERALEQAARRAFPRASSIPCQMRDRRHAAREVLCDGLLVACEQAQPEDAGIR